MGESRDAIGRFFRELASLSASGVPLERALQLCAQGAEASTTRDWIAALRSEVRRGHSLSSALRRHPRYCSASVAALVALSEISGRLDTSLKDVASYHDVSEQSVRDLKRAVLYGVFALAVVAVIASLALPSVLPRPGSTLTILAASGALLATAYKLSERFANSCDHGLLQLPVLGSIARKLYSARFSRALAVAHAAGVPPAQALEFVAPAINNRVYQRALEGLAIALADGQSIGSTLRLNELFPETLLSLVAIGEESGALDAMLFRAADQLEAEVATKIGTMKRLLPPVAFAAIGLFIVGQLLRDLS